MNEFRMIFEYEKMEWADTPPTPPSMAEIKEKEVKNHYES